MRKDYDFNKKDSKIIDAVKCNGRYTDISTIRVRVFSAGAALFAVATFACLHAFVF